MTQGNLRIWVLLGHRLGDNNQLLALAEALQLPFETRTLSYNPLWMAFLRLFPKKPYLLTTRSRSKLSGPWPDLVIGIGRRSVAISRWIKDRNGGRTRIVRLGNPRAQPHLFDLIVTTPQYPVERAQNVMVLPVSMARHASPPAPTEEEAEWLDNLPRPHLLVSVGGATRYWTLPERELVSSVNMLAAKAQASGGSLIVATSPRTPAGTIQAIEASGAKCHLVADGRVRYPVLLADADENFVTADSGSMISEAVLTGKPVGLIPVELDKEGQRALGAEGFSETKRDIRRFWTMLQSEGMVGTVPDPKRGTIENPVQAAVAAVKKLLRDGV